MTPPYQAQAEPAAAPVAPTPTIQTITPAAPAPAAPAPAPAPASHFSWLNFLIMSGAVAANTVGAAEVAQPGANPFVNPAFDVALFNGLLASAKAAQQ